MNGSRETKLQAVWAKWGRRCGLRNERRRNDFGRTAGDGRRGMHAMLCYAMLCCAVLCYAEAMLWYAEAVLCRSYALQKLCMACRSYAMQKLCYAMLCGSCAVLCCALPCGSYAMVCRSCAMRKLCEMRKLCCAEAMRKLCDAEAMRKLMRKLFYVKAMVCYASEAMLCYVNKSFAEAVLCDVIALSMT